MLNKIKGLFIEEEGQALTEYGLIIACIAILVVAGLTLVKDSLYDGAGNGILEKIAAKL
jgi:pilus assembly protein Flp/PilA